MENKMFCYQCQETAGCAGCTQFGVCGKSPELSNMQDLLIYVTKGLSAVTTELRAHGEEIPAEVNHYITINLFTTITNANFDDEVFYQRVAETLDLKNKLLTRVVDPSVLPEAAIWTAKTREEMDAKSTQVGILTTKDEDVRSLRELIIYGLKGLAAYLKHANELKYDDAEISAFMQKALAATLNDSLSANDLIALTLETGKFGVTAWHFLTLPIPEPMVIPRLQRLTSGSEPDPAS
jgi:hydroxylamine reductase